MLDQIVDSSLIFSFKTILVFLVLVILEVILSADNAIALAAIAQGLPNRKLQKDALNLGLVFAYILRMALISTATWVMNFWQFELLGALYLLWLVFNYFTSPKEEEHHHSLQSQSLWQAIPSIAITDLAFSLDSVTTAIAIADDLWLILLGGTVGVITLRFLAELFIHWLEEYTHLEDAGFITVGLVGVRLLIRVINTDFVPPEWLMISTIALLFLWGFSKRSSKTIEPHKVAMEDLELKEHEGCEKISS
ncbi:MAG: TerC family protein [cyanobacterium endosymbiont of Rhopalodia yunnanensis]